VVRIQGPDGTALAEAQFDYADYFGFPISKSNLEKRGHPKLSRKGEAEMFLLGLLDGQRTVAELEEELVSRYSDCFPSPTATSAFVKELIRRNS